MTRVVERLAGGRTDSGVAMAPALDGRALATGALLSAALVVLPALIAQALSEGSDWALLCFGLILAGFVVGGAVAGRGAPEAPYTHGALAALGGFAVVQAGFLLARAVGLLEAESDIDVVRILFFALLASSCGAVGGVVADWEDRRRIRRVVDESSRGDGDGR